MRLTDFGINRNEIYLIKVEDIVPLPFIILCPDAKKKVNIIAVDNSQEN